MGRTTPIYAERDRTYQADTCRPLVRGVQSGEVTLRALARGHYPGHPLTSRSIPEVKSVGYWDAQQPQSWGLDWHRNEGIELTFLESGTLAFAVDGQRFRLHPGDLTITRPWQRHRVGGPNVGAGRLHWLILDLGVRRPHQSWRWPPWLVLTREDRDGLTRLLRHNEQPVWRAMPELRLCFQQIARTVEQVDQGGHLSRLAIKINELLLLVYETLQAHDPVLDEGLTDTARTVTLFLEDLRGNLDVLSEEWTVPEMAARCGLGATRFNDYCRSLTNLSPLQFLNQCRLDAASRLLRESPELGVTQVALRCGYGSSQYFANAFRRRFECSPTAYRSG
ncbi:HTH-type transcriptional activator RhaS [Aquisphaera giovannonii]|uniref:HTH-type transcriptional activator RhaS n=1 Tax=Aquisphaera giovannonii TaxID=406548 RepID=A0A5B9WDJ0_9BACT|nr:helix-turn-helix domain-containing protein [Aquisphaera giovannonii]QEH37960.1 HTH-type transcriptional activator RhaS [Aquisphaera giovannonii]